MRFFTVQQAREMFPRFADVDAMSPSGMISARFYFGSEVLTNVYWLALRLVDTVGPWEDAWLWVDKPDTWRRNGLHLYTRLRQSYGDDRLVQETPVHYFHAYEEADLTSFVVVGLLNQWTMHLFTSHDYGRVFVSKDSGAEVWVQHQADVDSLAAELKSHGLELG